MVGIRKAVGLWRHQATMGTGVGHIQGDSEEANMYYVYFESNIVCAATCEPDRKSVV